VLINDCAGTDCEISDAEGIAASRRCDYCGLRRGRYKYWRVGRYVWAEAVSGAGGDDMGMRSGAERTERDKLALKQVCLDLDWATQGELHVWGVVGRAMGCMM